MKRTFLALLSLVPLAVQAAPSPVKVLMVTGDWMSQAWYQDRWMAKDGVAELKRGRFIAAEVEKAAPGRFAFTDITNYAGQEYLDANWLSQFDVLLLGDITGWSLNPRFQEAVRPFVENGGGLAYCASWKWHCAMSKGTPFDSVLPGEFPADNRSEDWKSVETASDKEPFTPRIAEGKADHPLLRGLAWDALPDPTCTRNFAFTVKDGAEALLVAPSGAPVLAAWELGKGRAVLTGSLFANDGPGEAFGTWQDFGAFYAQLFAWLGGRSSATKATLKDVPATADATIDFSRTGPAVPASHFALHGAHDCPGFVPLEGRALENFQALNPKGQLARFSAHCATGADAFDFTRVDSQLAEMERLGLVPLALFDGYGYGGPKWMWEDGSCWSNPSPASIAMVLAEVDAFLAHANGRGGTPEYALRVPYVEICNEPDIRMASIPGFARLLRPIADHVHANFPGVGIGTFGGYEIPYLKPFIRECGGFLDWISRHPYGWTGEMLFAAQDDAAAYAASLGHDHLRFIVTECDFWIQGPQKFDYLMKRNFEAVQRENLLGVLHYRLGQYAEPVYLFGVLWAGWGQERGAGEHGAPMHDAYDAFWIFRDFRGRRVDVDVGIGDGISPGLERHLHADAAANGDALCAVLYYDWAYEGEGYADFAEGVRYPAVETKVKLSFPAAGHPRTLSLSRANGEGFEILPETHPIPAGETSFEIEVELSPVRAVAISIQATPPETTP